MSSASEQPSARLDDATGISRNATSPLEVSAIAIGSRFRRSLFGHRPRPRRSVQQLAAGSSAKAGSAGACAFCDDRPLTAIDDLHPLAFQAASLRELEVLLDDDGRPLGEHAERPEKSEQAQCPYAGSRARAGRPMNTAALGQLRRHFSDALLVLGAAHDFDASAPPLVAVEACLALPFYVARNGVVPTAVAVAWKAAKGLRPVLRSMHLARALSLDDAVITAAEVVDEADNSGALVGNREVCAAPPAMLLAAVGALLMGGQEPPRFNVDPEVWKRLAWANASREVSRVVAEAARWWIGARALPVATSAPSRPSAPLRMVPLSVDDRLRGLEPAARAGALERLRPLVDEALIAAALGDDPAAMARAFAGQNTAA
jgi:hypothetical protein